MRAPVLTLLLVRHASHGLLGRVLAGRMPGVNLSEAGRAEATRLAEGLAGRGIRRVLSSPLERTRATAGLVAGRTGCPVEIADEINEIDCGAWTGATFETLAADPRREAWNRSRSTASAPGGESMAAVQARAMGLVQRLAARDHDDTVVLVSHADVVKAIVCDVLGLSLDRHDHLAVDPASVTTLHVWRDYARLVRLNEVLP